MQGEVNHLLKDIGFRWVSYNEWCGVFLDVLVFTSELHSIVKHISD